MTRRLAPIALLCLTLAACGGDDDGEATTTTVTTTVTTTATATEPAWDGPPPPADDGTLATDTFNAYLDATPAAPDASPLTAAAEFVRADRQEAATSSLVAEQAPEAGPTATVVATFDGLLDDSVRAVRFTLELERGDAGWRLTSARQDQRCQPNRGHQDFSPELCV